MRLRLRHPAGSTTLTLADDATLADLKTQITSTTGFQTFEVKSGYPPTALNLSSYPSATRLSDFPSKLNGEQLLVSEVAPPPLPTLNRKETDIANDPPELALPSHSGTLVLRVMPDDNSCLFRAIACALSLKDAKGLRALVAAAIKDDPETYSEAVLERSPAAYCRWIQQTESWGGAIEISILSKHFGVEIDSISVSDLRVDRFNEGAPIRIILVYSGIHYDTLALNPSSPPFDTADSPAEVDIKSFPIDDEEVVTQAQELCRKLQEKGYFTDTTNFEIKCKICGWVGYGEEAATKHATRTGHLAFDES